MHNKIEVGKTNPCFLWILFHVESFFEFVDSSTFFYILLFSSIERMAFRTNLNSYFVLSWTSHESISTSTTYFYFIVFWLYIFLHHCHLFFLFYFKINYTNFFTSSISTITLYHMFLKGSSIFHTLYFLLLVILLFISNFIYYKIC